MAPSDPGNMSPDQLATFLHRLRAHPHHLGLYAILERVGCSRPEVVADAQLAGLLPQGLKAALQLAQQQQQPGSSGCEAHARPSTAAQLLPILDTTTAVLQPAGDVACSSFGAGSGALREALRSQLAL